jgi:ERCC4-related helicase
MATVARSVVSTLKHQTADQFKLVWFLAPTVTLCQQQHHTLQANFPAVCTRLIVGSDDVECWKTRDIWDDVLRDQRIVVTTHAILSDALFHGFVIMQRLALLIYDEGSNIPSMLTEHSNSFPKRTIALANIRQTRL